jgi:hypothetical protein
MLTDPPEKIITRDDRSPLPAYAGRGVRGEDYGSGKLNALTMNAAIAWRLTAVSGQ